MLWLNIVITLLALIALALFIAVSLGPDLKAEYDKQLQAALQQPPQSTTLTELQIAHLPAPVQRYLRVTGTVGKPQIQNFLVSYDAEMFQKPGQAGMPGPAEQFDRVYPPKRLFFMRSRMFGLPVAVLHHYDNIQASMRVRVASLFNVVNVHSEALAKTETVTLLNDLCFFAPSSFIDQHFTWLAMDERHSKVSFTNGPYKVSATLEFDDAGYLVNFVSEDRGALQRDGTLKLVPWSTPMREYREFEGRRIATKGETIFHYAEGDFAYGRFVLKDIHYDIKSQALENASVKQQRPAMTPELNTLAKHSEKAL